MTSVDKMRNILLSTTIWLATLTCFAQEQEKQNMFSLNVGPGFIARQDLIFSPLIHKSFTFLNVGIAYTREAKLFQKASLRFGNFNPMVATPYNFTIHGETHTAYPHSFNVIDLDYLIGKNVKEFQKSTLAVGGLFTMDVQAMNYVYGRTSSFGYYSLLGLGMFGRHQYSLTKKSKIATTLQLPFINWLARSPYLVNDDEFIENTSSHSGFKTLISFIGDGQFVTWNRMQTFDLEINYIYDLNERWKFGAGYVFEFIHSSQPRNLLSYRQSINLSANFRF
jgi:hypothetical protein